jgi:hypothetical protein
MLAVAIAGFGLHHSTQCGSVFNDGFVGRLVTDSDGVDVGGCAEQAQRPAAPEG